MSIEFIGQTGLLYRQDRVSLPGACPFLPFERRMVYYLPRRHFINRCSMAGRLSVCSTTQSL